MLILYILILLLSFYLLAEVCDKHFVPALETIGKNLNMSTDVAGATLMAIGSSAPELFIAIIAIVYPGSADQGHAAIGMGTIVGSALFNILVIVGAAAIVKRATLSWQPVVRDILFYAISIAVLIIAFTNDGGTPRITITEASIFVGIYVTYLIAVMNWRKWFPYVDQGEYGPSDDEVEKDKGRLSKLRYIIKPFDMVVDLFFPKWLNHNWIFAISILFIAGLCWVLVESAVQVSHILNVPEVIIALTVLAVGTSVPDMISSVIVAKQGKGGMAVSNAFGSNIFDILIGLGAPWLITLLFTNRVIEVTNDKQSIYESILLLSASVFVVFAVLLLRKWKIKPWIGYFLISLYVVYLGWQIILTL